MRAIARMMVMTVIVMRANIGTCHAVCYFQNEGVWRLGRNRLIKSVDERRREVL